MVGPSTSRKGPMKSSMVLLQGAVEGGIGVGTMALRAGASQAPQSGGNLRRHCPL